MEESSAMVWRRIPERYGLIGSFCETCSTNYFPPREICPKCRRKGRIKDKKFIGRGKVYSFTEIRAAPSGMELQVPYVMAIIELEEGVKVTGHVVNRAEEVKIGTPVEVVFRKIQERGKEGLIHYGFKFKVVK